MCLHVRVVGAVVLPQVVLQQHLQLRVRHHLLVAARHRRRVRKVREQQCVVVRAARKRRHTRVGRGLRNAVNDSGTGLCNLLPSQLVELLSDVGPLQVHVSGQRLGDEAVEPRVLRLLRQTVAEDTGALVGPQPDELPTPCGRHRHHINQERSFTQWDEGP